jgi:hypothetical protein
VRIVSNTRNNLYETCYVYLGTAHLNEAFHKSLSLCVCMRILAIVARQRLGKRVLAATNARIKKVVGPVVFCMLGVVSKENMRLVPQKFLFIQHRHFG